LFILDGEGEAVGDPTEALESAAAAGFRETELLAEGEEWDTPGGHDAGKLRAALERLGIFPHSIHTPFFNVNLASPEREVRRTGIAVVADAMTFLAELGGRTAIVHPSGRSGGPVYALDNIGTAMEYAHRSMGELVKVAQETGVRIALENLPGTRLPCRPLESTQELRAFIADFPSENVGICLDVGHCLISGYDPTDQARIASERLYALHLQDGDGRDDRHWMPGRGMIDWPSLGAVLSDVDFDGAWTIEVTIVHTDDAAARIAEECAALRERWEGSGIPA
jgi:sugar phosphate isomerase/epimerase